MSATNDLVRNLTLQIGAGAGDPSQSEKLGPWAHVLMTAALAVSTSVAAVEAHAQQIQQRQTSEQSVMSERSAARWSGQLGSILGAEVGAALGQNVDPAIRRVIVGASSEMGRNVGQITAAGVRQGQQMKMNQISQDAADRLDQMGLDAAFAYDNLMRVGAQARQGTVPRSHVFQAQQQFDMARKQFANSIQSSQRQGYSVETWSQLNVALQQRFVNEREVTALAQNMAERLNRPGGPGYRDLGAAREQEYTGLTDLRERLAVQRSRDRLSEMSDEQRVERHTMR